MKKKLIVGLSLLLAVSFMTGCNKETKCDHAFTYVAETYSDCCHKGHEGYYKCSKCDNIFTFKNGDYQEISSVIEKDYDFSNHISEESIKLVNTSQYKSNYEIDEEFDLDGTDLALKCNGCEDLRGQEITKNMKTRMKLSYPSEGKTKFTVYDLNNDQLKINLKFNEKYELDLPITVGKKHNEILGLHSLNKHCGFKPFSFIEGVTSTSGTISYSFEVETGVWKTAEELGSAYSFMLENGEESKTIRFKAVSPETESFNAVEKISELVITHNEGWNFAEPDYDYYGCLCSNPVIFNKRISTRQNIIYADQTHQIDLSETSFDGTKDSIESIKLTIGPVTYLDIGTNIDNINVSTIKSSEVYGDQNLIIKVNSPAGSGYEAATHEITVPVTFVDDMIYNNLSSFKKVITYVDPNDKKNVNGYFKLAENITRNISTQVGLRTYQSGWDQIQSIFSGTLDGGGYKIEMESCFGGLFHLVENGELNNVTLEDYAYNNVNPIMSLIGSKITNMKFKNVNFKVCNNVTTLAPNVVALGKTSGQYGWISHSGLMNSSFTNCHFDLNGAQANRLLCTNNGSKVTMDSCTLKCGGYYSLFYDYAENEVFAFDGLDILEGHAMLGNDAAEQVIYVNLDNQKITALATNSLFKKDPVYSIKIGDYDLGKDLNNLAISNEMTNDSSIRGINKAVVELAHNDKKTLLEINVDLEYYEETTPVSISRQILEICNTTNVISLAGTEYANDQVVLARIKSKELGNSLSALNGTELSDYIGEQDLTIRLIHNGDTVAITVPVLVVDQAIDSNQELQALTHSNGSQKNITGYYALNADLDLTSNYSEFTDSYSYNKFNGTFDGFGHTITYKSKKFGIFGYIEKATIKNLKVIDVASTGGINQHSSLLCIDIINSRVENVEFEATGVVSGLNPINTSLALSAQSYGWISSRITQDSTFVGCTFNHKNYDIQTLLGTHSSCVRNTFSDCSFTCGSYYCIYQSSYTNTVTTIIDGMSITGTCLYSA